MTLRVLHVGKFFPPHAGGMEVFLADLVRAQREQGIEAAVLVHGRAEPDDPAWVVRVPVWGHLVYAPLAPGFRAALARAIARFEPDVLHLHLPNTSALWALTLASARARSWVVHWHADVVQSRIRGALALAYRAYRPFEQAVLRRAECVFVTSPPYLAASGPLCGWRDKCRVVPLGLDDARLAAALAPDAVPAWREGRFRLLSIGRLTYYKGFETLIRAASALPEVELQIVGDGELRGALQALIEALTPPGAESNVRLLGALDEAAKHGLLASCDAFCLASRERTEAFGLVLLEAMHHAKPCIVSDLPGSGMPWVVEECGAGATVPLEDVAAWRDAIERFRTDRPWAERCGRRGQQRSGEKFALARCAASIAAEYRRAAPESGATATGDRELLVVIPARNEAQTIASVLGGLRARGWTDVVVVNDQSTDATATIAAAAGAVVLSPVLPLGAWGAMQTGIRYALRQGYRRVVTIDADGQHEPAFIPALLAAAADNDVVIGAFPQRGSRLRRIAWRYFRTITGFGIEDLTSGFRCYNRAACELLAAEEATLLDYQDLGVLLMLRKAGLAIAEVPVEMYERLTGPSRIFASWSRVARYMAESTLLCLARWNPKHHLNR